ncbi:C40 family peptidase [Nocardioides sp. NBC_00850]|uniref:C40 family peptidase n=1 Tax=Nocardioides sp. NBC_00850 TaxID=2976001 RepID=UPI0038667952|nr:C40 family peptidase [Nocardioides sp. NBC_00850]
MTVGLATALVVGLALVAAPNQSATAASPPGASAQTSANTSAQTSTHTTKKKKKKSRGLRALRRVKSQAGDPYSYGANGPRAYDCSGLTQWVYKKLGRKLPHSSSAQVSHTFKVKKPRKGDLVFFYGSGGVYQSASTPGSATAAAGSGTRPGRVRPSRRTRSGPTATSSAA